MNGKKQVETIFDEFRKGIKGITYESRRRERRKKCMHKKRSE